MAEEVKVEEQEESRPEVTVAEVRDEIQIEIDNLQDNLDKKFEARRNSLLVAKPRKEFFIVRNKFWDQWFQKLFSHIISVTLWIVALITILLSSALITSVQFAAILGIIMGLKGTFQVADVWKKNGNGKDMNAMDKT